MKNVKEKNITIPQNQKKWVREEVVLLVSEYYRTRYLSNDEQRSSIAMISHVLRNRALKKGDKISDIFRNMNGISMQMICLKNLDPEADSGLSSFSKLQKDIMQEYIENPNKIQQEAEMVLKKYQ